MMRLWWVSLVVLSSTLAPVDAGAGPPSPGNSTIPRCLVVCPAGDMEFEIVVRDGVGNPHHPDTEILIDLCGCPEVQLCPPNGTAIYSVDGCHVVQTGIDFEGVARFRIRAGGTCAAGSTWVIADRVPLANPAPHPPVASPDQNGDLVVDAVDRSIAAAKLGTSDLTADFDCDSLVTEADLAVLEAHMGHSSASTVDVADLPAGGLELAPAEPNPFIRDTRIRFSLPAFGPVRITVHDLQGRVVITLANRVLQAGWHTVAWNGRDAHGVKHRAGIYWVRLAAAGATRSRSIVLAD